MDRPPPWTAALAAASALCFAAPELAAALALERAAALAGEPWRLWTGQLVHGSLSHLAWDLAAFLLLGWRLEPLLGRRYPAFLLAAATVVGAGVLAFLPGLASYCGLSGVVTAQYAYLALADGARGAREGDRLLVAASALCAAALAGKLAYEHAFGAALFASAPGLVPVPLAHLAGALAGAAAWWATPDVRCASGLTRYPRSAFQPTPACQATMAGTSAAFAQNMPGIEPSQAAQESPAPAATTSAAAPESHAG